MYHTANSWNDHVELDPSHDSTTSGINMLGCRLNSATLVYSAGNLLPPSHVLPPPNCPEKCQLYYWRFDLEGEANTISHEFALSDVPFEFPTINEEYAMAHARYVYGTSMRDGTFDAGLGKAAKIDALVKIDAATLIRRGKAQWGQGALARGQRRHADRRGGALCATRRYGLARGCDQDLDMPRGWYAQETTFRAASQRLLRGGRRLAGVLRVRRSDRLHPSTGDVLPGATSELWIIDAKHMQDVVCPSSCPNVCRMVCTERCLRRSRSPRRSRSTRSRSAAGAVIDRATRSRRVRSGRRCTARAAGRGASSRTARRRMPRS